MLTIIKSADVTIMEDGSGRLVAPLLRVVFAEAITPGLVRVWYLEGSFPYTLQIVQVKVGEAFPVAKVERMHPLCRYGEFCYFALR